MAKSVLRKVTLLWV